MAFLEYEVICLDLCVYLHEPLTANSECGIGRENDRNEANGYWPQLIFSVFAELLEGTETNVDVTRKLRYSEATLNLMLLS